MSDEGTEPKIYVDDDWKAEAQREKEQLAGKEQEAKAAVPDKPGFAHLVNMLAMQAVGALGGMQTPTGETIPPDLAVARFHIDLLDALQGKTKGNLTDDEKKSLDQTVHELRMAFVQVTSAGAGGGGGEVPPESPRPDDSAS